MVQVDVFWSYALGSSLAAAAARQLKDEDKPFQNNFFQYTVLYLALLFGPSGVYLLWNFPHWETMQVARTHSDIPAWLVVLFGITNITQGILGYWVSYKFIRQGKYYAAHMQWFLGYFFMFYILLYGWDGLGWQRFLYDATVNNGVLWEPGKHMGFAFLTSNVAITLAVMGLFIVPFLGAPMIKWIREGAARDPQLADKVPSAGKLAIVLLGLVFVVNLGSAAVAAVIVHFLTKIFGSGWIAFPVGMAVFFGAGYFVFFRKNMPGYQAYKMIFLDQPA